MSPHLRPLVRPVSGSRALVWALAALAVLGLAACGSSSPSSSSGSGGGRSDANALAFSRCMRSHGITNFPDPETKGGLTRLRFRVSPGGPTQQTMETAQRACKRYAPFEQVHLSPQQKVERQEAVLKFARCMREHGVDVHGSASGGGFAIRIGGPQGGPNPESPTFQAAQKACQGLLPLKGGGPATGAAHGGGPGLGIGG